jgi:phenylpropionate dioxygenase-like ring-hydroxylating dioxygenase large terminal subunit
MEHQLRQSTKVEGNMHLNGQASCTLEELVARQRPGFSLEQPFYTDPAIFELDMQRIYGRHWQYVGHVSRIPARGDYFLYTLGRESIIIIRGDKGEVHALFNVCRHRGSHICVAEAGSAKKLVCPYHAWVYDLDGRLLAARNMLADLDKGTYGLARCHVQVGEGLIFISLAEEPSDFAPFAQDMAHFVGPHKLSQAKIAHHKTYVARANWKLLVENTWECYHCGPAHPQFCSVMSFATAQESPRVAQEHALFSMTWEEETAQLGHRTGRADRRLDPQGGVPYLIEREGIGPGMYTQSEGGRPVAPLMGDFKQYDGGLTRSVGYPLFWFVANNDHAFLTRFAPLDPQQTEVDLTWIVHPDAQAGVDYDPLAVSWLMRNTLEQDIQLCERNQAGINSDRYRPGPYSGVEDDVYDFVAWYLRELVA